MNTEIASLSPVSSSKLQIFDSSAFSRSALLHLCGGKVGNRTKLIHSAGKAMLNADRIYRDRSSPKIEPRAFSR